MEEGRMWWTEAKMKERWRNMRGRRKDMTERKYRRR